jgi:copper chaperone CopZ
MKLVKRIASNKTIITAFVLALIALGAFAYGYNAAQEKQADPASTESYPTPVIKTADEASADKKVAEKQSAAVVASTDTASDTAKVIFQVEGMSCSGCIYTIKSSLSDFEGIQDIIVNISAGITEVYFDNSKIKDVNQLASAITASGYRARVSQILTADHLKKEQDIANARAESYIASVSGWDISRTDFNTELTYAKNRYRQAYGKDIFTSNRGKGLLDSLKAQVVSRLVNEGIQMQEVQRAGFRVDLEIVDQEFEKFILEKELDFESFKASMEQNGYSFAYFMKKFENRVLLNRYLDERVLGEAATDFDKQKLYLAWFNNARVLSKVVIYDKELERLTQNQSAGSSCCSTGKS